MIEIYPNHKRAEDHRADLHIDVEFKALVKTYGDTMSAVVKFVSHCHDPNTDEEIQQSVDKESRGVMMP